MLRQHLASRLLDEPADGFTDIQLDAIDLQHDRIYRHKVLHINYTTYNMRRDQDTINPRTHPDILLLALNTGADSDPHPYWYACVIDIFHAQVRYTGPGATRRTHQWQCIEFLWVRWFELDPQYEWGFQARRQPRLRFVNTTDACLVPFGFVDPNDVIRAAYIMPMFAYGQTSDILIPSSVARRSSDDDEDYEYYYGSM